MSTRERLALLAAVAVLVAGCATSPSATAPRYGLGQTPTAEQIRAWDIDIGPDGAGLPPGAGSVAQGRALFAQNCIACHGAGGQGTLNTPKPVATVGSFWPHATTLFDYIRRAMPHDRPQSLSPSEVYALSAYLLHQNGIVGAETVLDATSLARVRMPNRGGFTPHDPRPDINGSRCMSDCK
jgi:cytochrome c